jgi:tetratricopeptide (TPR) repeat protein/predicted Ser/Thr protein kinase
VFCSSALQDPTLILTPAEARHQQATINPLLRFTPGTLLAGRYEVVQLLGEGGMGAVYKAHDRELDRNVALKVIRPDLSHDPKMLERFKQEIIVARQVTHKNVVRIFDLGTHESLKFITMEYVEGSDLATILQKQRLTAPESARIIRQVCRALEAAHAENVIHRDLKPQNIMIHGSGRACVMDFGLARTIELSGMTQTGAMIGTPAYMSPEQAKGNPSDARSDIYSVGVMFYSMLTGKLPFQAETMIASLLKRTQELPPPPQVVDDSIPKDLSDIVMKCLAIDPADRYASASEVAEAVEAWIGGKQPGRLSLDVPIPAPSPAPASKRNSLRWVALAAALALIVAAGGWYLRTKWAGSNSTASHAPVTALIADVDNRTGDAVFDGTLEPVLRLALEGATFISAYDRTRLRDLGVPPSTSRLDLDGARKIAIAQGLGIVLSPTLTQEGGSYKFSVQAIQPVTGNVIARAEDRPVGKSQVLSSVGVVAEAVRGALGDAEISEADRRFAADTLSSTSLDAVHQYSLGMNALSTGKFEDALASFTKATEIDKSFGLAYAGMGVAARNLGSLQDAQKYVKLATAQLHRMTERERYRTRGFYYALIGDHGKCIEEYGGLIARYSADTAARNNLAFCLTQVRNLPRAVEEMRQAVSILPKRAMYRNNLALYQAYRGDFQAAEQEAREVQTLAPKFALGFVSLAFSQLGRGDTGNAEQTYRALDKLNSSIGSAGLGDLALYQGRFSEAARIFEQGAAADAASRNPDRAAAKYAALAYTELSRGQKTAATAAAEKALANSSAPAIRLLAGRVFAEAGNLPRARALAADLASGLQVDRQVYAKLVEGEIALVERNAKAAVRAFAAANNLIDTWGGRFGLGRAYLQAGAFPEADSEFDRCLQRRGEALSLFLDELPTFGYLPPVYYYQGRVREGLGSAGSADSYRAYLSVRGEAGEDPLLPEIRRRLGN